MSGKRVLYVDSDVTRLILVRYVLEQAGYDFFTSTTLSEAKRLVTHNSFDCVVICRTDYGVMDSVDTSIFANNLIFNSEGQETGQKVIIMKNGASKMFGFTVVDLNSPDFVQDLLACLT